MRKAMFCVGCLTTALVLVVLLLIGFGAIERALTTPHLNRGVITQKCYNDGSYWYSKWTWGNLTYTQRHGGEEYYYIEVSDGKTKDYWTVDYERWEALSIGEYVRR